jgi:hypothetical protein
MSLAPASVGMRIGLVRLAFRAGTASADDYAAARRYVASQPDLVPMVTDYLALREFEMALIVMDEMLVRDPGNTQLRAQREVIARRSENRR